MWRHAPVLRPSIEAWVEQTIGVIMTHDGPALADATNAPSPPAPEPKEAEHLETPDQANFSPPEENAESLQLDPEPPLEAEQSQDIRSEPPHFEVNQVDNVVSNQIPRAGTTANTARVEPPLEQSPKKPHQAKPTQQRQPVEILTSAGEWVSGYSVHCGIAVANLAGSEHRFKLFDALGSAYIFFGQIRPPLLLGYS